MNRPAGKVTTAAKATLSLGNGPVALPGKERNPCRFASNSSYLQCRLHRQWVRRDTRRTGWYTTASGTYPYFPSFMILPAKSASSQAGSLNSSSNPPTRSNASLRYALAPEGKVPPRFSGASSNIEDLPSLGRSVASAATQSGFASRASTIRLI